MTEIDLPQNLQAGPDKPDSEIPVDMSPNRTYSAENVNQIATKLGLATITGEHLQALRDLGLEARSLGVLEMIRGGVVVSQSSILTAIQYLQKVVVDDHGRYKHPQKESAARTLGYLSEKLIKLYTGAVKVDQTVAEAAIVADKVRRQSFAPGMRVIVPTKVT